MELNITTKEEKPLLSRTEIFAEITFDASTPSKEEIKKKISSALKSDQSTIVIKKVDTMFGQKQAKVLAFVYTNEKDMKRIEPKPKAKKEKKKEAPKEEPKETPKEEKKEEPKKEEKPKGKEAPKAPKKESKEK